MTNKKYGIVFSVICLMSVISSVYAVIMLFEKDSIIREEETCIRYVSYANEYIGILSKNMNEIQCETINYAVSHKNDIIELSRELLEYSGGDAVSFNSENHYGHEVTGDVRKIISVHGLEKLRIEISEEEENRVDFDYYSGSFGMENGGDDMICRTGFYVRNGELFVKPFESFPFPRGI